MNITGQAHLERERQAREARLERRAQRVIQGLVGVFLLAAVISAALAIFAFGERTTAQQQRDHALRQAAVNRSLVLANEATLANGKSKSELAMLLALEAVSIDDPPPDTRLALQSIAFSLGKRTVLHDQGTWIRSVAFSSDSHWALSGSCANLTDDGCIESELVLWNVENAAEHMRFQGPASWVNDVAFDPLGHMAFAAYEDGSIIAWDVQTGAEIRHFEGEHTGAVSTIAISPDGAYRCLAELTAV